MEVSPSCDLLTWPHGAQGMPRSHALPPSGARSALHDLAAVRMQHLPAHVRGVVRSQEDEAVGHLVRLGGRSVRCLWPLMHAALDADLPLLMPRWHGMPLRHAASSGLGSPLVSCVPHSQAATCVPDMIAQAPRTAGARAAVSLPTNCTMSARRQLTSRVWQSDTTGR